MHNNSTGPETGCAGKGKCQVITKRQNSWEGSRVDLEDEAIHVGH